MKQRTTILISSCATVLLQAASTGGLLAGDLDTSIPPGPTMKTLEEVEPRVAIDQLPFTITASGSYYLAQNFDQATAGITISGVSGVTIDLMGFTLGGGTGSGIGTTGTVEDVTVQNGIVRDWSVDGLNLVNVVNAKVVNVIAANNGVQGIIVGNGGMILGSIGAGNTGGLRGGNGSTIHSSIAHGNGGTGIFLGNGSVLSHSTSRNNGDNGIFAGHRGVVGNCVISDNTGAGIFLNGRGHIEGNVVDLSGEEGITVNGGNAQIVDNAITNSLIHGIRATGSGSVVHGNLISQSGEDGIVIGDVNQASFNTVSENTIAMLDPFVSGFDRAGIRFLGQRGQIDRNVLDGVPGTEGVDKHIRVVPDSSPHSVCVTRNYALAHTIEIGSTRCFATSTQPWENITP